VTVFKFRYLDCFIDRHGKPRYYFRRGRGARVPLPGSPGSAEFMSAYQSALGNIEAPPARKHRGPPGTFDRLIEDYFASSEYARLAKSSQRAYRLVIERLIREENVGHRLVREMNREHVKRMVAKRASTPGAANDVLKKIRILTRFAIDNGWRRDDPTIRIRTFAQGEFHTWADQEISAFEEKWSAGTRERTAFALLLYTGQRLSDVAKMSWRDLEGSVIRVVQGKTGMKLSISLHPDLATVLGNWPKSHGAILTTNFGRPFTSKGFRQLDGRQDRGSRTARSLRHARLAQGSGASPCRSWLLGKRNRRGNRSYNSEGRCHVNINGFHFEPMAPFGGFKQSGMGRENGAFGLSAYLEPKTVLGGQRAA
jgi:enterobacteria phage integrase